MSESGHVPILQEFLSHFCLLLSKHILQYKFSISKARRKKEDFYFLRDENLLTSAKIFENLIIELLWFWSDLKKKLNFTECSGFT